MQLSIYKGLYTYFSLLIKSFSTIDLVKRLEEVRTENGSIEQIGNILMEWVCFFMSKMSKILLKPSYFKQLANRIEFIEPV